MKSSFNQNFLSDIIFLKIKIILIAIIELKLVSIKSGEIEAEVMKKNIA